MKNSGRTGAKRPDGLPVGKPFEPGQSGNPAGRPKGSLSLDTIVRQILEGEIELPPAIASTIRAAVGADKKALEAMVIVGLLLLRSCRVQATICRMYFLFARRWAHYVPYFLELARSRLVQV